MLQKQKKIDLFAIEEKPTEIGFMHEDKKVVTVPKHKRRIYKNPEDKLQTVRKVVEELTAKGVVATPTVVGKAGFGRQTDTGAS